MSLKYIDKNGAATVLAGLTPGGNLETGAVATREGNIQITVNASSATNGVVTFVDPMPDTDYEIIVQMDTATTSGDPGSLLIMPVSSSRTVNGFYIAVWNYLSSAQTITIHWKAFKLYEVADAEALYSEVTDIKAMIPANASSTNKFTTADDLRTETRTLDRRLDDVEDVIPTSASITNKLVTQNDLSGVEIDKVEDINDVELTNIADGQTLIWDDTNSKWINGQGGKIYTAGDGINISNTDEISAKVDDTSITTDTNDALKVADTYKTIFVGTRAQWDALSTADKVKYNEAHITDDVIGGEVADEVTDGLMSPVTSNAVYDHTLDVYSTSETKTNKVWIDGKPIYRKVFHYAGVTTSGTSTLIGSITGFADIISIEGTLRNSTDNNCFPLGYTYSNFGSTVIQNMPFVIGNNGSVYANPYGFDITNINVIVEYTKTT